MGELEDLIAEAEVDFEIATRELFGATIEEMMSAKREIITGNDHTIDWDAPAEDIVDTIAEVEDNSLSRIWW